MNKKTYVEPRAEKLEFEYDKVVAASGSKNPAQCTPKNPGHCDGGFVPGDGDYNQGNAPGNCSYDVERKQPFKCV